MFNGRFLLHIPRFLLYHQNFPYTHTIKIFKYCSNFNPPVVSLYRYVARFSLLFPHRQNLTCVMARIFISSIISAALCCRTNNIDCIHPLPYNQAIKDTDTATSLSVHVFLLQRYAVVPRVSKIIIAKT